MSREQYAAIMPLISADLVRMITEKDKLSPEQAIDALYSSGLYSLLEKEETKLWHYSTDLLYTLFTEEQQCGTVTFPDV